MASLGDKSVDHVITDPPYEAEAHSMQRRIKVDQDQSRGRKASLAMVEPLDFDPISPLIRSAASCQFARVSRRWILAFCQAEAVGDWRASLVMGGAKWKRSCVWIKTDGQPQLTGDRPGMGYESIACAHADVGRSRWNAGGKCGVYEFAIKGDGAERVHQSQKPIHLMDALIRDFTDPGDLILDPFAGSGTTGVAAIRLGRRFIGWERDPKYHAIAMKRLRAAREQLELCA
jgi:16S rRNA G966 N2-methylase RsmD